MLPKPTAVIFDWDGTLLNTLPLISRAIDKTYDAMGLVREDSKEAKYYASHGKLVSFQYRFGLQNMHRALELYAAFVDEEHDSIFIDPSNHASLVMPGTNEILNALHGADIPLFVLSNKSSRLLHSEVKFLNWQKYFKGVYGVRDVPHPKPDPRAAFHVLERAGIEPSSSIWFVGDSHADIACANDAGLTSIYVCDDIYEHEPPPAFALTNMDMLLAALKSLIF